MIEVYAKGGIVEDKRVVSVILKSQNNRWLKTILVQQDMTQKQMESLAAIYGLMHIKDKYRKRDVALYLDSDYLIDILETKDGKFIHNSSVKATKNLMYLINEFNNLHIRKFPDNEEVEELQHVFLECGYDSIILDERS